MLSYLATKKNEIISLPENWIELEITMVDKINQSPKEK